MKLTSWPCYFQAHSWFKGIEWDKLYQMKAAFIPEVNDELDTQNFEKFEEVGFSFVYVCVCTHSMISHSWACFC